MSTANSDYYVVRNQLFFDLNSATKHCINTRGDIKRDIHTGTEKSLTEAKTICNLIIPVLRDLLKSMEKVYGLEVKKHIAEIEGLAKIELGKNVIEDLLKKRSQESIGALEGMKPMIDLVFAEIEKYTNILYLQNDRGLIEHEYSK